MYVSIRIVIVSMFAEKLEIMNKFWFYIWLYDYIQGPGRSYKNDVKFAYKSGLLQVTVNSKLRNSHTVFGCSILLVDADADQQ